MSFDFKSDPLDLFSKLIHEAQVKGIPDHNAMALATVSENKPSNRIVLFKGLVRGGFSFFTNYQSRKANEIGNNNYAAATFFWSHLDRQIRLEGKIEKLKDIESDTYFASRPRQSQIGAWASEQSKVLSDFSAFQEKYTVLEKKFADTKIPRPENWGGFLLVPAEIEFWFGKSGRLHERYVFQKNLSDESDKSWNRFLRFP